MSRVRLLLFALCCGILAQPVVAQRIDSVTVDTVAPGVVHRHLFAGEGPWSIHVIEVDLHRRDLSIRAAHALGTLLGRETVSDIARRNTSDTAVVVAAVNADFFDLKTGENENNQVVDGEFWKAVEPAGGPRDTASRVRSQFVITAKGRPMIGRFRFSATGLRGRVMLFPLDGINYRANVDARVLYTAAFGALTPPDSTGQLVELRLRPLPRRGDTLRFIVAGLPVPPGTSLLAHGPVLSGPLADVHHGLPDAGDTIGLVYHLAPRVAAPRTLVGGWPRLIVHGTSVADSADRIEGTMPSFSVVRHPRTGVGFSRDSSRLYLVTVDGRQESSSGMSLIEFANLMLQLGVYEGLNLDGGGSTAMVVDGHLVNHPSDPGGERTVGNALLVVRRP